MKDLFNQFTDALVQFFRFYDYKIGASPIPPDIGITESKVWTNIISITSEDDFVNRLKEELNAQPLLKDIEGFYELLHYVLSNEKEWLSVFPCPHQQLFEILKKLDDRPATSE